MAAGEIPQTVSLDEKGHGKLPNERFSSYSEVNTYANAMIQADRQRSGWRADIDGQINGNQPIKPLDLKAKNMGWYPNINWRGLAAKVVSEICVLYDLVTEAGNIIDIDLDFGEGEQTEEWSEIIESHFTWLLMTRWREQWNYHLGMILRERTVHGLGIPVWPTSGNNWIPRTPKTGHVCFPEESNLNFSQDGEGFLFRDYVPLHTVYGWIRNENAARKLGWFPDNTWKAMAQASKSYHEPITSGTNLEQFQSNMKRGDLGYSTARQSGLWLDWVYVRELDSPKKSLMIVPEGRDVGGYLFKKRYCFDDWPLEIFPYDLGQGFLHSIRGAGWNNKDSCAVENRVNNAMLAQILLAATVQVQQTGSVDPDKLKLMKLGIMSILPQGVQLQDHKFPDLGQGPLALLQYLKQLQNTNNLPYAGGTPDPKDRETGLSFQMRAQDAAQSTKAQHGMFCSNLRKLYTRMLRTVIKASKEADRGEVTPEYVTLAKEFMKRCMDDSVPKEAFDHIVEIREVTSTGAGSPSARTQSLVALSQSPVYLNAPEQKKINLERDLTAAVVTGVKVDRYARSAADNDLTDSDDSMIAVENNGLAQGGQAVVSPTQNHVQHASGHLQKAQEIVQQVYQGQISPEEGLAAIQNIGAHTAQHLEQIKSNPTRKQEYAQLSQELQALSVIADKLSQQVEEAQNAEQPNPEEQISDDLKIGLARVQSDHQIRTAKIASDIQLKRAKTAADIQNKFRQTSFNNRINAAKATSEINRNKQKNLQPANT